MPPHRGRASKACATCHRIKTRCYEAGVAGKACLRCDRLQQPCSLATESAHDDELLHPLIADPGGGSHTSHNERLNQLEQTVARLATLVERLDTGSRSPGWAPDLSTLSPKSPPRLGEAAPGTPSAAPVFLIRDVASEVGVRQQRPSNASTYTQPSPDIISKGVIQHQEALMLVDLFQKHYGRWVSFTATSLSEVRKSALMLCACCLIAVRHTTQERALILAPQLFLEAKALLSSTMLEVPQSIEFFQSAVIFSMWSTTIGQTPLSIDSWLLSGFALQHSLASDLFALMRGPDHPGSLNKLGHDRWCIWNHLCLAHLHYCVGTRRRSMLDRQQIDKCRQILDSDHATNFETRMVAEINLYWIIYKNCLSMPVDLPKTQSALNTWKQEWKFLFDQPRSQFLQMGFYFAQLLSYDQALKSRSARVKESLLSEMVRLSAATMQLALDTSDDRTRHLSDHIYHAITFAAITLCRLLHMYESQVATSHNIVDLDSLVLTLVTWLHSIGLPCHVAHTFGDVVQAFHKKLRPSAHSSPYGDISGDIELYFPELLGMESFDGGNFDFIPDWEPYNFGPAT